MRGAIAKETGVAIFDAPNDDDDHSGLNIVAVQSIGNIIVLILVLGRSHRN